jgi:septum site-determining protein MinC
MVTRCLPCYDTQERFKNREGKTIYMNWQQETESTLMLDLSAAANSVQAFQILDSFLGSLPSNPESLNVEMNASDLLLTRGVVTRMSQQLRAAGLTLHIFYAILPQTQQAALDEGWMVKLKPSSTPARIRQPIEEVLQSRQKNGSVVNAKGARTGNNGIDLPSFGTAPNSASRHGLGIPKNKTTSTILSLNKRSDTSIFEPKNNSDSKSKKSLNSSEHHASFEATAPKSETIPELGSSTLAPEASIDEFESALSETLKDNNAFANNSNQELREVEYSEAALQTLYWRQNLRSGQTLRFEGNIVIIGDVHAGSEVTASGDIIIWGELRGVAHAGAQGNYKSEIRAMKIEALQLRISDYIARRPDRIYYHKDDSEGNFAPEIARVADGEIKIYKTRTARV